MSILLVTGMTTFAQGNTITADQKQRTEKLTPEQRNEKHLKKLTERLNLSAAQQQEIAKLFAEQNAKREAFKAEKSAGKSEIALTADQKTALKNRRIEAHKAYKARLQAILTPEQMAKWEEIQKERKTKGKDGKKREGGHKKDQK